MCLFVLIQVSFPIFISLYSSIRYAKNYMTHTRKQRVDQEWVEETLRPYASRDAKASAAEDAKMERALEKAPMPTTVAAFKGISFLFSSLTACLTGVNFSGHPLYALPRHLLKFEAIYPSDAPTLGFLRGEPIYARECVKTLHCRVTWLKEGRTVTDNLRSAKEYKDQNFFV